MHGGLDRRLSSVAAGSATATTVGFGCSSWPDALADAPTAALLMVTL